MDLHRHGVVFTHLTADILQPCNTASYKGQAIQENFATLFALTRAILHAFRSAIIHHSPAIQYSGMLSSPNFSSCQNFLTRNQKSALLISPSASLMYCSSTRAREIALFLWESAQSAGHTRLQATHESLCWNPHSRSDKRKNGSEHSQSIDSVKGAAICTPTGHHRSAMASSTFPP